VPDPADAEWQAAAALKDPRRRAMYELLREADRPLTRDEVADATGMTRNGVGFHLDALVDAGLLVADYARPPGRGGPGAGRPSKRYATTDGDLQIFRQPRIDLPDDKVDAKGRIVRPQGLLDLGEPLFILVAAPGIVCREGSNRAPATGFNDKLGDRRDQHGRGDDRRFEI